MFIQYGNQNKSAEIEFPMLATPTDTQPEGESRSNSVVRLWLQLSSCEKAIEQRLRSHLSTKFGITLPQFELLCEIDHSKGPVVMSRLSEKLNVTGSNITGVVDRLERKGLLKRFRSNVDRRVQHIRITSKGRDQFKGIAADVEAYLALAFSGMTDEEVIQLQKLLQKTALSAIKALS